MNDLDILDDILKAAASKGADAADAILLRGTSVSHAQRLGKVERLEREEGQDLGLRVFLGRKQAIVSTSDLSAKSLEEVAGRALDMARVVPDDPYCGLAPEELLIRDIPDIDCLDPEEPSAETLIARAEACEDAARAVSGVTNSEGAEANYSRVQVCVAASNGFSGSYARSGHSLSAAVLAGEGTAMERDYDYTSAVYAEDLRDAEEVGRSAGEKAVARLNPRKAKTGKYPVIYHPRVARGLLGHFAGAINGAAIARGTSFLKDMLEKQVFPAGTRILDDPLRKRGLRSKPFDGEGLPAEEIAFVEGGVLTQWVLDLSTARQLDLRSNGRAARGVSGPPSPSTTNLYLAPGELSPEELIADIGQGLFITEMMGMGVNGVTGDYSRGAAGFWIEKGERAYPVSEVTVAGNLKELFKNVTPANDLVFRYGTDAPSLRIEGMTVAGS